MPDSTSCLQVDSRRLFTFAVSIWLLWVVLWQAHRHHLLAALLLEADAGAHRLPKRKGVNSSSAFIWILIATLFWPKRERRYNIEFTYEDCVMINLARATAHVRITVHFTQRRYFFKKLLRSLQESILPAYVDWRTSTTTLFLLVPRPLLIVLKFQHRHRRFEVQTFKAPAEGGGDVTVKYFLFCEHHYGSREAVITEADSKKKICTLKRCWDHAVSHE